MTDGTEFIGNSTPAVGLRQGQKRDGLYRGPGPPPVVNTQEQLLLPRMLLRAGHIASVPSLIVQENALS